MDLAEVRRALKLSQDELAQTLNIGQAAVAKMEKRAGMYVSTLRRFIEAMGGRLDTVPRCRAAMRPLRRLTASGASHPPKSFRESWGHPLPVGRLGLPD